jgi:anti-sigma factor RsiW
VTCREFAGFMAEYLGGDLPAEVRAVFERHLSRCANCRTYLASYTTTIEMGRRAFDDDSAPVAGDVPRRLIAAILSARRSG